MEGSYISKKRRRRRIAAGQALLTASLVLALTQAGAQDNGAKAGQTTAKNGQSTDKSGRKGSNAPSVRIVPMPRQKMRAGKGPGGAPPVSRAVPGGPAPMPGGPPPGIGDSGRAALGGGFPAGGTKFQFDFHGSDILNVLKFYAQMAHMTVLADPGLSGPVTIINPEPVDLDQAFMILQQVLAVRGFSAIQNHGVISIEPFGTASKNTPILNPGVSSNGQTAVDPHDQVMTQVIPLENVDAEGLAKDLQPLINNGASLIGTSSTNALILTDTASNVQRFLALATALDKTSNNTELRTYPLKRAEASAVADIINNLFKQLSSRGRAGAAPQPGQPGFNPGQPQPPGGAATGAPAVLAVPDMRTNSVLVVGSPDNQEKVANEIINRLDGDDSNTLDTQIRKINFANAVDVANLVNTVLSNMAGGNASNANNNPSFQQRAFGFNPFFGGGGNEQPQTVTSSDPFGKVIADPRTNSVLITASADRMKRITDLIDQLDKPVPAESTTFVFPLKNANAQDVAYALGQAFDTGNQNGYGNFNTFFFGGGGGGGNNNGPRQINRRLGQNSNSPFGRAALRRNGIPPGPPNAPDGGGAGDANAPDANGGSAEPQGVPGVMTPNGFVPTEGDGTGGQSGNPQTRQFFFGGRYGGQRGLGQSNGPQYGRGRNGGYSNLLQLQDNVFVTPAPGGDSVIVTTTPENYDAVRQIIEALDVVPRQVMIEVIVAEITLDKDQKLGFALSGIFKNLFGKVNSAQGQVNFPQSGFTTGANGTSLDPTATGAQFVINGADYSALLQALESNTKVKVLATPRVFTSNNQEALVAITQNIPYISGQTFGGFTTTVSNTVVFQEVGYQLDVTPRITREGQVTIDVDAIASNLLQFITLGSGANASPYPIFDQREANTEATVQDGQTVAIGGLIQNTDTLTINKIPLLADIPLIGQFFRSREKHTQRDELMIFLTPHVVNSAAEARELSRTVGSRVIQQLPDLPKQQPNLDLHPHPAKQPNPTTGPNSSTPANNASPAGSGPSTPGAGSGTGSSTNP